ncbi:hypothetical protein ScPMuIL_018051 [Solemya velum]
MNTEVQGLSKAFLKQQERIRVDEMMADREHQVRLENGNSLRAEWNEALEESSWKKRITEENKLIQEEIRLATKASLSVRRVALQQLLCADQEKYELELHAQGKTFFKQRI